MLTLDLALITYGTDGINRVAAQTLPSVEGVRYVVSWQRDGDSPIPDSLQRNDITIVRTDSRGAAINRNNAIDHCTADIILFADDDIIYSAEQLSQILVTFENDANIDLACFKATHPSGPKYPSTECRLGDPLPKGYWVSAYQIAYRRERLGDLRCHPDFGAGSSRFVGADDELFLLAAIRRGYNCRFIPINICTHPDLSTGTTATMSPGNLRAAGCYITLAYPHSFILRLFIKAWRISRKKQSGLLRALRYLIAGSIAAPAILRKGRNYLW